MKEYKIAAFFRVMLYAGAPLLTVLLVFCIFVVLKNENTSLLGTTALILILTSMIILSVLAFIEAYKARIIIYADKIVTVSLFSVSEIRFEEVSGYFFTQAYIVLQPVEKSKKQFKIPGFSEKPEEIISFVEDKFPRLEDCFQEDAGMSNDKFLDDKNRTNLQNAKKISKFVNGIGFVVSAWAIIMPSPYQYAMLSLIIIPLAAIIVLKRSKGLIKISPAKGSIYPTCIYAVMLPSMVLMARTFLDFKIFDYSNLWCPAVVLSLCLTMLLVINSEISLKKVSGILMSLFLALIFFMYSFGTIMHINCFYDNSELQHYTAEILKKRISTGKNSDSFYVTVGQWAKQNESVEFYVNPRLYKKLDIGKDINIYFRNGKFNIPWFVISDSDERHSYSWLAAGRDKTAKRKIYF